MYIYLSKKINVPNNSTITCSSWNKTHGFVAAGCENGLIKIIKLEMTEGKDPKAKGQPSGSAGLLMNETLQTHKGEISCITWNDKYNKLTTADTNGKIIVWINYENQWSEEMVNNRDNTIITGIKWSPDGQNICITYNDGVIIMGSLEGTRIWMKEIKNKVLTNIEWSPDKTRLLVGINTGEIFIHDFNGNPIDTLKIQCLDEPNVRIATIDWYKGLCGYIASNVPCLAVCYSNGRCQLMKNELDDKSVLIDCSMEIVSAEWNNDGSILAIAGFQLFEDKVLNQVQFYSPWGEHLKTLKIPGTKIRSCNWEGNGLRLVIAIDSLIYFANIRPTYKWCYVNNTIVYSFTKPGKNEQSVVFFDTKTGETNLKYMKNLLGIIGEGESCALICQAEETSSNFGVANNGPNANNIMHQIQYAIVLCNLIGTPIEYKYIDFRPSCWTMNSTHILVASRSYFYLWNYQSSVERNSIKKHTFERLVFIENPNAPVQMKTEDPAIIAIGPNMEESKNKITCITMSDKYFFIGREAGFIQKFSLTSGTLVEAFLNESNGIIASRIFINSNSSRIGIVDNSFCLKMYDLTTKVQKDELTNFKRNDVWNMVWSSDNAEIFVTMEKIKMHVFRDIQPEEPMSCSGYICSFSNLEVKVIFLDDIMSRPENPLISDIVNFDSKLLRETRDLIEKSNFQDAIQFIEANPHERLWRLLAESSLNKLDLKTSEIAFVKCKDYHGIEFVKKLQNIPNQTLKKAEIAAYFNNFEEAELLYLEMDRKDLAYQMRKKLGDWFKVLQLLKLNSGARRLSEHAEEFFQNEDFLTSGAPSDSQLEEAYNEIGDLYFERQKWDLAVKFYNLGRNLEKQAECFYIMEDYSNLCKLMDQLPENSELLGKFAQMFESVGMCKEACEAYLKAQNVKAAVDACVKLNQWDEGVRLAKQYNIGQVDILLAKQATSFLDQNKIFNAIELYRKARHYLDAARLMFEVIEKQLRRANSPLLVKKMYVLAGLLVEQYRDLIKAGGILPSKAKIAQRDQASKTLDGILTEESQLAIKDSKIIDNAWRGAEAYHFLMLCERQLREGKIDAAFKTSMALMEYEDILNPKHIYSLIALCACGNGSYNAASKAFIKLESCESIEPRERAEFETLAFQIFSYHQPKDKKAPLKGDCPQCGTHITEWFTNCPNCDTKFAPCIVSGRPILEPQFWVCGSCKHRAIEQEIANRISCPLCHMPVR